MLDTIILDMSRIADSEITNIINKYKKERNILQQDEIEANHQNLEEYDLGITNSVM